MKQQINGPMVIVGALVALVFIIGMGIYFLNPPVVKRNAGRPGATATGGGVSSDGKMAPPSRPAASVN